MLLMVAEIALSVGFLGWTIANKGEQVVKFSQPMFLGLIAVGTIVSGLTTLALANAEDTNEDLALVIGANESDTNYAASASANLMCQLQPWLYSIGFCLTFAPLFAKLWRINKIFNMTSGFKVIKVS